MMELSRRPYDRRNTPSRRGRSVVFLRVGRRKSLRSLDSLPEIMARIVPRRCADSVPTAFQRCPDRAPQLHRVRDVSNGSGGDFSKTHLVPASGRRCSVSGARVRYVGAEYVADAAHRADQGRPTGPGVDLLSQPRHQRIDRAIEVGPSPPSQGGEKDRARERLTGPADKGHQQVEFGRSEIHTPGIEAGEIAGGCVENPTGESVTTLARRGCVGGRWSADNFDLAKAQGAFNGRQIRALSTENEDLHRLPRIGSGGRQLRFASLHQDRLRSVVPVNNLR